MLGAEEKQEEEASARERRGEKKEEASARERRGEAASAIPETTSKKFEVPLTPPSRKLPVVT